MLMRPNENSFFGRIGRVRVQITSLSPKIESKEKAKTLSVQQTPRIGLSNECLCLTWPQPVSPGRVGAACVVPAEENILSLCCNLTSDFDRKLVFLPEIIKHDQLDWNLSRWTLIPHPLDCYTRNRSGAGKGNGALFPAMNFPHCSII